MKLLSKMAGIGLAFIPLAGLTQAQAQEVEWSGNVTLTTDYVFRGISQTNEDWALQGGFDLSAGGFYAGTWASNVDFEDDTDTNLEIDLYGGYTGAISDTLSFDVGAVYYAYPDSSDTDLDLFELYGGLGYESETGFALGGMVYYEPDAEYVVLEGSSGFAVSDVVSIDGGVGFFEPDEGDGYSYWNVGGTLSFEGFDFDLRYHDTDVDDGVEIAEERIVLSVSRAM
jgi:uncharacterized protein (TIGR02001 family)